MPVLFPPADLLTRFERFGEPIIREIQSMFFVQANLRAARNLLLPKLISGEIDVSDAVREVESTIKKAAAE